MNSMDDRLQPRNKIKPLDELGQITQSLRAEGKAVVLCHGVFDLLHFGHLRHLQAARAEGDVLVVTISGDHVVNKGPGRPVFPEALRAEMLAGLAIVDYVGINPVPGAESVIETIKPSVYAKGKEYEHAEKDVTGRIVTERTTVERFGGRVAFTDDITFSSSELINRHFRIHPPAVEQYLSTVRDTDTLQELLDLVDSIRDYKVMFVGDTIVDEYQYVEAMGKASKEHIIATKYTDSEIFCGGVIQAANIAADFVKEVEIVTVLGERDSHEEMIRSNLKPNVKLTPFFRPNAPTTLKRRMVEPTYTRKLFEVAFINDTPLAPDLQEQINDYIRDHGDQANVVVVTDFGHGLIASSTIDVLCGLKTFLAVNAQTNSANHGFNMVTKYPRADLICIDAPEARLATHDRTSDIEHVISDKLAKALDVRKIIVTHGAHGCIAYDRVEGVHRIPAFTRTVVDTMGAGDAFLAVSAPLAATGKSMSLVGFVGNAVGAIKVGVVGHRKSIDRANVIKYLTALLK